MAKDDWLLDTAIDKYNLSEECVKQPGLFGFWANKELNAIKGEDAAMTQLRKAEDQLVIAKARANANMRGLDLAQLNKLLGINLPKPPDVALWKELVILHPNVKLAQAKLYTAQEAYLTVKHIRLDRKNARRSMEAKAQELNNLIYLQNREYGAKESYTVQPKQVRQTHSQTVRRKAEEQLATQLRKRIKSE